jgi:hypothetical protein
MPIRWRSSGDGVATVDLRRFGDDQIVIHFGGALKSIDAYTFANSLVAFADTVRSVNGVISPGQAIEVRVEAIGDGSFRAVVKKLKKGIGGFFARGAENIFWALVATLIYERLIKSDPAATITVNTTEVVMQIGEDRVIVPRVVYDQAKNASADPEVQRSLSKTFQAIEADEAVENFGLTAQIDDPEPIVQIPRADFPRLTAPIIVEGDPSRREHSDKARLVILKAWLTPGLRKWSFEWNGVPISAPIKDTSFWEKMGRHEIKIGQGDALDVEINCQQTFDPELQIWINDPHTFEITKVLLHVSKVEHKQTRLFD